MRKKNLFFRRRLYTLLKGIEEYPITVLVASTGYGKTTVVQQYLEKTQMLSLYVDITSSKDGVFWQKLCDATAEISPKLGQILRLIGLPSDDLKISSIITAFKQHLKRPLILVVDDCQLLGNNSKLFGLFTTIALEEFENLHLVLLSQTVPPIKLSTLVFKDYCLFLERETLAFNLEETGGYLELKGMHLASEVITDVYQQSEGWISVLFFICEAYRHGRLDYRIKSLNQMFEENFLWFFNADERQMLIRLASLKKFTADLAIAATGNKHIGKVLTQLEKNNAFITVDAAGWYSFHALLKNYLKQQCADDVEQKRFYLRAGCWYLQHGEFNQALQFYWQAGQLEKFLQKVEHTQYWTKNRIWQEADIVASLIKIEWTSYPLSFLQIAFALLRLGREDSSKLGYKILKKLEAWSGKSKSKLTRRIQADCILIQTFLGLYEDNDWNKHFSMAQEIFQGEHSLVLLPSAPITFGMPMFLYLEYREPGMLDKVIEEDMACPLENMVPGFGHGMDKVIQAEAALERYQLDKAVDFARQARVATRAKEQYFLEMCAVFTLLRKDLVCGDYIDALQQMEELKGIAEIAMQGKESSAQDIYRQVVEFSEAFLYTSLEQLEKVPETYLARNAKNEHLLQGMGLYNLLRARSAYLLGNESIAAAECDLVLELRQQKVQHSQLIRLAALILKIKAEKRLLNNEQALKLLDTALKEAAADEIYLPFVENAEELLPLLTVMKRDKNLPSAYWNKLLDICHQQKDKQKNWHLPTSSTNLSERELEALKLAANGYKQNQIAQMMQVKDITVKKHLINAYAKLGVSNKVAAIQIAKIKKLF
jgi:LuxR family maltose regulon positive regulatory protein